jgi:RNA polymerase sigma factor (sigma-70 family)
MRRSVRRELAMPDASSSPNGRQFAGADPTPSQQFARDELTSRVRQAIAALEEIDREILLMRSLEGLSYREVSYILEIDESAARKRHGRALLRLHAQLARQGFTESQF